MLFLISLILPKYEKNYKKITTNTSSLSYETDFQHTKLSIEDMGENLQFLGHLIDSSLLTFYKVQNK